MDMPKRHRLFSLFLCVVACCAFLSAPVLYADAPAAAEAEASPTSKFLRYVDTGRDGSRLETGVVTYQNKEGVKVTLVAAIHIGEKSYFEGLNRLFTNYDAVLYELVKPKDEVLPAPGLPRNVPKAEGGMNLIGDMQHFMKDVLNLQFQLDVIDYTRPNFIHADLDRETFEKMQAKRGESFEMMMLQQMMQAMSKGDQGEAQAGGDDLRTLLKMLTRPDMERQVKKLLAKQIGNMDTEAANLGTVIVAERNKACTKVLQKTLEGGKKNVAIFYGAAHMPDLEDRLSLMGFKQLSNEYRQAWDLTIRADQPSAAERLIDGVFNALDEGAKDDDDNKDNN